jgi:hypothetical protein
MVQQVMYTGAGFARTGTGNGWVRNSSGWNDLLQTISVAANHTYTVTGWIGTSANTLTATSGYGHRGGQAVGEQYFTHLDGYTKVITTVNTGSNTSLVLCAGLWRTATLGRRSTTPPSHR